MRRIIAMVTIFVALFAGIGSAWGVERGNKLYELLTSKSLCIRYAGEAYILGVVDTTHSINTVYHLPERWTMPSGVTKGQIFDVVKKYLEKHPEERHNAAIFLVEKALAEAFPLQR